MLKNGNCLFQYCSIEAFEQLHYDGTLSIKELKELGNFGLGCFNALNGELYQSSKTFDLSNAYLLLCSRT